MINKDTILSVYTDKQTLLEYLTKIETALDKAVLTSSQLVYEGANNYHFKFVFEDGSSIETPSITLVQPISKVDFLANGNSVHFVFTLMDGETITTQTINLLKPVTAAAVRDGILYLTLSDGTEVSAGSITASFGATTFNGDVLVKGNFHQTDGNAILGGNAEVDGNLKVNGTIEQGTYEFDEEPDISLETSLTNDGFSIYYKHARESNGKLSIVIALAALNPSAVHQTCNAFTGTLTLPESILSKLCTIPSSGGRSQLALSTLNASLLNPDGNATIPSSSDYLFAEIFKTATGIYFAGSINTATTGKDLFWRFEFNFILS